MAGGLGFSVAVNYLQDRIAAESVVKTIEDGGSRAVAIQGDASIEADGQAVRGIGLPAHPPTALVNNAASSKRRCAWTRWMPEDCTGCLRPT